MEKKWYTKTHLTRPDGFSLAIQSWFQTKEGSIVLLLHGMGERLPEYDGFINALVEKGYIVIGYNQRGHDEHAPAASLSHLETGGFDAMADDAIAVYQWAQAEYNQESCFLFGHSMGSFIARRLLQRAPHGIRGAVLAGSGGVSFFAYYVGRLLTKLIRFGRGGHYRSPFLNRLFFDSLNARFRKEGSSSAWLTRAWRDLPPAERMPPFSVQFFYELLNGVIQLHKRKAIQNMKQTIPLLFLSGTDDPVGKGLTKSIEKTYRFGNMPITFIRYYGARHELLNEYNAKQVQADILSFLQDQI